MDIIEIIKSIGGLGAAVYILVQFLRILEKWLDKRAEIEKGSADSREKAYTERDKQLDETLRGIGEIQKQSLSIHEKAIATSQDASRSFIETSRLIADEMRLNRSALEAMGGKVDGVPSRTQTLFSSDLDRALVAANEHNTQLANRIMEEIQLLRRLIIKDN